VRSLDPRRSRVILIGTSKYHDKKLPDLPEVSRNVSDLVAVLTDPLDGIVQESNCDVIADEGDIRLIGRKLRDSARQAEDLLLVYYSGHGLIGGRRHDLYLGLPDSEWAGPEFNSLEFEKLRSAVLDSTAATKIIILDCCFSGRAATEAMTGSGSAELSQIEVDGSYVLTSAHRDQLSLIIPGEEHTAFTGRLIQLLRNGVPDGPEVLTIDDLYRQLSSTMRAAGLSEPQRRATNTAGLLPIAKNHAFVASPPTNKTEDDHAGLGPPTDQIRGGRRWLVATPYTVALGAISIVALGAIIGVLLKFAIGTSNAATISQSHVVVAPSRIDTFSRAPSLEKSVSTKKLLTTVFRASNAQMTEGVSAVYQQDKGGTEEIFLFVGGLLSNTTPAESVASFMQDYHAAHIVSAGTLGGKAACAEVAQSGQTMTMCIWFDNDTFGELMSPTMSVSKMTGVLLEVRPQLELPVTTRTHALYVPHGGTGSTADRLARWV
jgi:hypothetical protein